MAVNLYFVSRLNIILTFVGDRKEDKEWVERICLHYKRSITLIISSNLYHSYYSTQLRYFLTLQL